MTDAARMIEDMKAKPGDYLQHSIRNRPQEERRERITIKFPGRVELRSWGDPTSGKSYLTVEVLTYEPKEE